MTGPPETIHQAGTMLLLIDNYDSFTFNLVQYLGELGAQADVRRNDAISVDEAISLDPDGIVLSPGPCRPETAGICCDLVLAADREGIPLLGVCLGHQAIAHAYGGHVVRHTRIVHGKTDRIHNDGKGLFSKLPPDFIASRYHSLVVEKSSLPAVLTINAWTGTGTIMGLMHRNRSIFGVQFHPESIASESGHDLLQSFLDRCRGGK